eukprot:TRINITY_DN3955_c0_g1_i2.p1 TRINITY_DN3955_c0_g1~~TRINITY_DN3955_c0_g1_i2.p1  ORF type:complete len:116 (-),score=16.82 TRINITY_DN3955_c0_g1_i2:469-816(-)
MMLILWASWCHSCKKLRPKIAQSTELAELSRRFVMVNALDDEKPNDDFRFQLDGSYIPRIYFVDANGHIMKDVFNKNGNYQYKYYYGDVKSILSSMRQVIAQLDDAVSVDKQPVR